MSDIFEPIPSYGDLMTLDHFIELCRNGGFINYDGHGHYAFKDKMSNKEVHPSDVTGKYSLFDMKTGKFKQHTKKPCVDKSFTHVVWFNR